jgi:hypothetical protein
VAYGLELETLNFSMEEWDATGQHYETLAICRPLELARAVLAAAAHRTVHDLQQDAGGAPVPERATGESREARLACMTGVCAKAAATPGCRAARGLIK